MKITTEQLEAIASGLSEYLGEDVYYHRGSPTYGRTYCFATKPSYYEGEHIADASSAKELYYQGLAMVEVLMKYTRNHGCNVMGGC